MTVYRVYSRRGRLVCSTTNKQLAKVWGAACNGWIVPKRKQPTWAEQHGQVAA